MAMERTDSTAAMANLVAMYEEKSDDEDKRDDPSPSIATVDDISDDEEEETSNPSSRPPSRQSGRPALYDESSVSSTPDQPPTLKRNATRLVSYAQDELEDDSDSDRESDEERGSEVIIVDRNKKEETSLDAEQASSLSRSVLNKSSDEIELPPEPAGKCPRQLQEKIAKYYEKQKNMNQGWDLNESIKRRKDFRNPSIYEKLIEFIGIDEKGTNYPPEIYDPHAWGKESYYDALYTAQRIEMEKREKERKDRTKIEFVTGTKKSQSADTGAPDEKKRKSKWDSQIPVGASSSLTSSATGTKSTVIPATGSITKKAK